MYLQCRCDFAAGFLGLRERVNELFVFQNVSLRVAEHLQNFVFDLLELPLEGGVLDHEPLALLFEFLALALDGDAEKLVLEAREGDGEVDEHNLGADLRGVVGIRELGGDEHSEFGRIAHDRVADVDDHLPARLVCLLQKQRL